MMEARERYDQEQDDVADDGTEPGNLSTADIAGRREAQLEEKDGEHRGQSDEPGRDRPADENDREPLLPEPESDGFRSRWEAVQIAFVDEPRDAVRSADQLVAELMQRLAQGFSEARADLEGQWEGGGDVSTEDLRVALQRYRSFFNRLLAA